MQFRKVDSWLAISVLTDRIVLAWTKLDSKTKGLHFSQTSFSTDSPKHIILMYFQFSELGNEKFSLKNAKPFFNCSSACSLFFWLFPLLASIWMIDFSCSEMTMKSISPVVFKSASLSRSPLTTTVFCTFSALFKPAKISSSNSLPI